MEYLPFQKSQLLRANFSDTKVNNCFSIKKPLSKYFLYLLSNSKYKRGGSWMIAPLLFTKVLYAIYLSVIPALYRLA